MLSSLVFYLVASTHMFDKWSNISVSDKFDVVLVWIFDTIGYGLLVNGLVPFS